MNPPYNVGMGPGPSHLQSPYPPPPREYPNGPNSPNPYIYGNNPYAMNAPGYYQQYPIPHPQSPQLQPRMTYPQQQHSMYYPPPLSPHQYPRHSPRPAPANIRPPYEHTRNNYSQQQSVRPSPRDIPRNFPPSLQSLPPSPHYPKSPKSPSHADISPLLAPEPHPPLEVKSSDDSTLTNGVTDPSEKTSETIDSPNTTEVSPPKPSSPQFAQQSLPSSPAASPKVSSPLKSHYAISGSRPVNPSQAHGLVISRKAKPPPDVVKFAFMVIEDEPAPVPALVHDVPVAVTSPTTPAPTTNLAQLPELSSAAIEATPTIANAFVASTYTSTATTPMSHTPSPSSPVSTATSLSVHVTAPLSPSLTSQTATVKPKPKVIKSWADLVKPKEVKKVSDAGVTNEKGEADLNVDSEKPVSVDAAQPSSDSKADPFSTLPPLHILLTTCPPTTPPAPLTQPRGLINSGNVCFTNVVLQALLHTTPFYKLVELVGRGMPAELGRKALIDATVVFVREFQLASNVSPPKQPSTIGSGTATPLTPEQLKHLSWQQDSFVPEFLYNAMGENKRFDSMQRGRQEDAEEFLGFFLDTLHEELLTVLMRLQANPTPSSAGWAALDTNASVNTSVDEEEREVARPLSPSGNEVEGDGWLEVGKKNKVTVTRTTKASESAITRIFGGKLRSVLRTPGVSKDSVTLEPYQPLQLDIQSENVRTIEQALINLTQPEIVQVHSPSRGGAVDATKQVFIETLPPILVVHIKRFLFDMDGVQKSNKVLMYRTTLEIPSEAISPARRTPSPVRYKLYGVIYHHGKYANGGHYTIDLLRQDHSEWIRIDDTTIEAISEQDVAVLSPDKGLDRDKVAYLLFYQRVDDPTVSSPAQKKPAGQKGTRGRA